MHEKDKNRFSNEAVFYLCNAFCAQAVYNQSSMFFLQRAYKKNKRKYSGAVVLLLVAMFNSVNFGNQIFKLKLQST
jgi:hypothetical protein